MLIELRSIRLHRRVATTPTSATMATTAATATTITTTVIGRWRVGKGRLSGLIVEDNLRSRLGFRDTGFLHLEKRTGLEEGGERILKEIRLTTVP